MHKKHFPSFYKKHVKAIYRYLYYRVGGNSELAEDLTQDVFLKALDAFEKYDPSKSDSAWIYTIARNHLLNSLPKHKKHGDLEEIENTILDAESWVQKEERKDEARRMMEAIKKMKKDEQELLIRKYMEGWSFKELAEEWGTTSGALRVKARRVVQKLQSVILSERSESKNPS